ncbi:MAG: M17 family peptidase N-terminal domain-containing protein, partial [Acidimicrobiales bacterium]
MSGFHVTVAAEPPGGEAVLAVPVLDGLALPEAGTAWPQPLGTAPLAALAGLGFEGKTGQVQAMVAGTGRVVVAVGLGDPARLSVESFRRAGAGMVRAAWRATDLATTLLEAVPPEVDRAAAAQALAEGALMAAYRFTAYR